LSTSSPCFDATHLLLASFFAARHAPPAIEDYFATKIRANIQPETTATFPAICILLSSVSVNRLRGSYA
jgi:hypothetical protein